MVTGGAKMLSTPYIDGKAIEVAPSALADVLNPANQKPLAKVFMGQEQHMRAAIDAAHAAKTAWGNSPAALRESASSSKWATKAR
jgi:acyl-CoA reductase-like NAD-dependent aldehyde dehydrogenase